MGSQGPVWIVGVGCGEEVGVGQRTAMNLAPDMALSGALHSSLAAWEPAGEYTTPYGGVTVASAKEFAAVPVATGKTSVSVSKTRSNSACMRKVAESGSSRVPPTVPPSATRAAFGAERGVGTGGVGGGDHRNFQPPRRWP